MGLTQAQRMGEILMKLFSPELHYNNCRKQMLEFKEIRPKFSRSKSEDLHRHWLCLGISVVVHIVFLVSIFLVIFPVKVYFPERNVRRVFIAPTEKLLFPEGGIETIASQPVLGETSVRERPSATGDALISSGGVAAKLETEIGTEAVALDPGWSSQFRLSLPILREKRPVWDQEFKLLPKDAKIDMLLQRVDKYRELESVDFSKYQTSNYYSTITGAGSRNRAGRTLGAGLESRISLKEVNYDLSTWADKVLAKIQKSWLVSPEQLSQAIGQVEILVMVNKSGVVESVRIVQAYHSSLLDETALKALELSSPLPKLPHNFPEERLEIRLVFLIR